MSRLVSTSPIKVMVVAKSKRLPGMTSYHTGKPVASSKTKARRVWTDTDPSPWLQRALKGLSEMSLGKGVEST